MEEDKKHFMTSVSKKKRRREKVDFTEIEGIERITLSDQTQKELSIVLVDDISFEKPWILVEKEKLLRHLELKGDASELFPIRRNILAYPCEYLLVGHIIDENSQDDFLLCTTHDAMSTVTSIMKKQKEEIENRLMRSIFRQARQWKSLGSEKVVEEEIPKRNRPLLEVEIQTRYPIRKCKTEFRARNVEDDPLYGYMELMADVDLTSIISKRRKDAGVQAKPVVVDNQAQTKLVYPRNAALQYQYEVEPSLKIQPKLLESVTSYLTGNIIELNDILATNYHINLYTNDYFDLKQKEEPIFSPLLPVEHSKEYNSLIDVTKCKEKMISSVAWHGSWKNIVAVAYCDMHCALYYNDEHQEIEVENAIYHANFVLVWDISNEARPLLILETQREVSSLSFCPNDENILVGGCLNGQIVLWNLENRLERVKAEEQILSSDLNYRKYLFSSVGWSIDTIISSYVPVTAVSSLYYPHVSRIVSIHWLSSHQEMTKTGKIIYHREPAGNFLQLVTANVDGTICIWDLKQPPVLHPKDSKYKKELSTNREKSSTLRERSSNLKQILKFIPLFVLNIKDKETDTNAGIVSVSFGIRDNEFESLSQMMEEEYDGLEPYESRSPRSHAILINRSIVATLKGEYMKVTWVESDVETSEKVDFRIAETVEYSQYHDGPVNCLERHKIHDLVLTTGGKIFAIWAEKLKEKPVFWRRRYTLVTYGCFTYEDPNILILTANGLVELWEIHSNSKEPQVIYQASNNALTHLSFSANGESHFSGLADAYGCFRIFAGSKSQHDKENSDALKKFIEKESTRKTTVTKWRIEWHRRCKERAEEVKKPLRGLAGGRKIGQLSGLKELAETVTFVKHAQVSRQKSQIEKYMRRKQLEDKLRERQAIQGMIKEKKREERDELLSRMKPLQILLEEQDRKKRKMSIMKRNSGKISSETVSMLFPDIVAKKLTPEPDLYAGTGKESEKSKYNKNYEFYSEKAAKVLKEKPFSYVFDVKNVIRGYKTKEQLRARKHRERRNRINTATEKCEQ